MSQRLETFAQKLHIDPDGSFRPTDDFLNAAYWDLPRILSTPSGWDPELFELLESDGIPAFAVIEKLYYAGHQAAVAAWAI
jgi:hypothetical protein